VAFPEDFLAKFRKAKGIKGLRFIHILSPCPPGWRFPSEMMIKTSRLAVDTKIFPLYEIENGKRYTITAMPKGLPVSEYLNIQGRFSHLSEKNKQTIQALVDENWEDLVTRVSMNKPRLAKQMEKPKRKSPATRKRSKTVH
jgi:pyruvate/2-oxoacid:ferredoxin oxidoreductase beta subunit